MNSHRKQTEGTVLKWLSLNIMEEKQWEGEYKLAHKSANGTLHTYLGFISL